MAQSGIEESSADIERSPDLSLAGVMLDMPAIEAEMLTDLAIRQRCVRQASLLLGIITLPAALSVRLVGGPALLTNWMAAGIVLHSLLLLLIHLWARRSTSQWPGAGLLALGLTLPIELSLLNPTSIAITTAQLLLVIPVGASALLNHRWVLPVSAISLALAIAAHALTYVTISEPLRELALIQSMVVVIAITTSATIGWFFSRGQSRLIEVSRQANKRLTARARRQTTLAYLGQRALSSFNKLASATVSKTPLTLDIELCALAISDDDEQGRWMVTFADSRRPKPLTIPVGSALDGALHDDLPTLVGLERELSDERLQNTRCLVVSATFTSGRRAGLLACSRTQEAIGENEVPFLQTALSLLSTAARRQEAEIQRSRSEARYADLVKISPDGIITVDREGVISSVNPAAAAIFDRKPATLTGQHFSDLGLDQDARADALELFSSVLRDPRTKPRALWIERPDGDRRLLEINAKMTAPGDGTLEVVAILRDITERHHLEEQLRLSQRLESLGLLAGGVAHDFNNILTIVITSAAGLRDQEGLDANARELALEIYDAGERAATLTNQLLAFSRRQVLSPRHVDLAAVIREIEKMLRRLIGEDIELVADLSPDLGTVYADSSQVEQALINLCVNARAAMPNGGLLEIRARRRRIEEPLPEHPQVQPGDYVHLEVRDNGVGMDLATQARIFEPFFTTKEPGEGTGLGLSMVHGFVQQSNGHIWPESELGAGTSIHVLLPADDSVPDQATPRTAQVRRGHGRILVIEDEPLVRMIAARILTGAGYDVTACDGPEMALETVTEESPDFDLVVSDVVMPVMSGIEVIKLLRERQPGLRAILVSGYPRLPPGLDADLRSMTLISKPFTPASLSAAVATALES
ncbi:MAG TPA: response regulator [Nannocystis exedens]|nr:response regulator [Nannocystis exedens]